MTDRIMALLALASVALVSCDSREDAGGAAFPSRPIEIVVPWAAGGTSDLTARTLARGLTESLPKPVIVANMTGMGGGGAVGHNHVKRQRNDGYTLLFSSVSFLGGYHTGQFAFPWSELQPLCSLTQEAVVVVVHGDAPWQDLQSLVQEAQRRPGKIAWAITGTGNSTHLVVEGIRLNTELPIRYISYNGGAEVRAALLGRHVDVACMTGGEAWENARAGKLRILAQSLAERSVHLAEVPTIREQGIEFSFTLWKGLYAPKGVTGAVTDSLNQSIAAVVQTQGFRAFAESIRAVPFYQDSVTFTQFLQKEDTKIKRILTQMDLIRERE